MIPEKCKDCNRFAIWQDEPICLWCRATFDQHADIDEAYRQCQKYDWYEPRIPAKYKEAVDGFITATVKHCSCSLECSRDNKCVVCAALYAIREAEKEVNGV